MRYAWLVALCACNARLGGAATADAAAQDAPIDAPADARAGTGGDAQATTPIGSCLVWFATPTIQLDARAACVALGAHLAYLKSAEVDAVAEPLVGTADTFIGGTDRATEGAFVWDDGTPFQ